MHTRNSWLLLADTRKKLLWLWVTIAGLIIALFVFMTLVNTFEGVEGASWMWALSALLPPLTLLFLGIVINPHPSKVVKKSTFLLLFYCALSYLLLVLATVLGMQAWLDAHTNQNIADYFQESYFWIFPFQTLLLAGLGILYFQNKRRIEVDEKTMLNYVQKKAEYAHRFSNSKQQTAFDLLIKNDRDNLFEYLKNEYDKSTEITDIVLLQSQYNDIQQKLEFNTTDPSQLQRELNRISIGLIDFIEKL